MKLEATPLALCVITTLSSLLVSLVAAPATAQTKTNAEGVMWSASPDVSQEEEAFETPENFKLKIAGEFGLLSVLYNKIQQGESGTYFDYVNDGGFELFNPFLRASGELQWRGRHNVILLYQPIDLRSRVRLEDDLTVDELTFPEGKMMDLRYGFDFFRTTYHYDLSPREDLEIGVGGGFQMRIAEIEYVPIDGSEGRVNRDLGPVPLLKFRARYDFSNKYWVGTEVDGFYANIRIANGDREADVTGAILDASLRGGAKLGKGLDGFVNLRYVGGGGVGTSPSDAEEQPGDGYTKNWAHFAAISLGFYFEPMYLTN